MLRYLRTKWVRALIPFLQSFLGTLVALSHGEHHDKWPDLTISCIKFLDFSRIPAVDPHNPIKGESKFFASHFVLRGLPRVSTFTC